MKQELQQIFDSVPKDEPRSRLEPYQELILRWRRQGRTYRRIQVLLAERCGVNVSAVMLCKFVRSRSRPRKVEPEPDTEPAAVPTAENSSETVLAVTVKPRMTYEERIAQRDAIRAAFAKPVFPPRAETKPRFEYDPDRPLSNQPTKE